MEDLLRQAADFFAANPKIPYWYTTLVRFAFPVLAILILVRAIRSLLRVPHEGEAWAQLSMPNGAATALYHWENIIGRSRAADVTLNFPSVSRRHAALIRSADGTWTVHDLDSRGGVLVNGEKVENSRSGVCEGDTITLGGVPLVLLPLAANESAAREKRRMSEAPALVWPSFLWLTLFQVLTTVQLFFADIPQVHPAVPLTFIALSSVMWIYYLAMRIYRCIGFEMETIAFFLSTLSLSITASSDPAAVVKQFAAIFLGIVLFLVLGIFMRDLSRTQRIRWCMAAAAIGLLAVTLVLGTGKFGAKNWLILGPFSFQPSEIAKICYIFAGSATLARLFRKRNLGLFMALTFICIGCLGLMSDFGTASIFFVTFLVIAYLRSGDYATLGMICGGAGLGAVLIACFKPYILTRILSWGHAWANANSGSGFQQTRTMSAAASGGLVGMGAGNGWLHRIAAGDTDLVFGMVCEEWGLVIALLAVASIVTLAVFAVRACRVGRSSFYVIAACAASSLLVFQTCLNVFGAVDLLPLTGVTFPFVSNGGSAMMSAWGLLAFLKAADTREHASFAAVSRPRRKSGAAAQTDAAPETAAREEGSEA